VKLGLFAINYATCADPEAAVEVASEHGANSTATKQRLAISWAFQLVRVDETPVLSP
jgi:hypothetical protein